MYILNKVALLQSLRKYLGILLFLIVLVQSGCGFEPTTQSANPPEANPSVPKIPVPVVDVLVSEKSRQTYKRYCTQCHGEKGHGDGINAPYLVVPPRDHTKADYLETRSDQQLFEAIKLGGLAVGRAPCMPAWGHTFDDKTIRSLVGYIRDLCNCKA